MQKEHKSIYRSTSTSLFIPYTSIVRPSVPFEWNVIMDEHSILLFDPSEPTPHFSGNRVLRKPYGKNKLLLVTCSLSPFLPRFIDVSSISHYPNGNGGNNNRTSILNRARIILVGPSLIAPSRFVARPLSVFQFSPPSLSSPSSMNYRQSRMFLN